MRRSGVLLLLAALVGQAALRVPSGAAAALAFEAAPPEVEQRGLQHYRDVEERAAQETWIQHLLGTDCYSRAVEELRTECSSMGDEQRAWLAVAFTVCQQRATRGAPFSCNRARGVRACVDAMDLKTHVDYTTFLANVHSMCLFLQNQRFQDLTAKIMTDMAAGSRAANATLAAMQGQLEEQAQALAAGGEQLQRLQALQREVHNQTAKNAEGLGQLIGSTKNLSDAMTTSLQLTDSIIERQGAAAQGLEQLAAHHREAAAAAQQQWEGLAAGAAALAERQGRYEALQAKLLDASEGLLDRTAEMRQLMELLLGAQARALVFLERLAARRLALRDAAFWVAAAGLPLLFVGAPDLKLGLLGVVLAGFAVESGAVAALADGAAAPAVAWAARAATGIGAAVFAGWRLRERGRAHRELVEEVKALRVALERNDILGSSYPWQQQPASLPLGPPPAAALGSSRHGRPPPIEPPGGTTPPPPRRRRQSGGGGGAAAAALSIDTAALTGPAAAEQAAGGAAAGPAVAPTHPPPTPPGAYHPWFAFSHLPHPHLPAVAQSLFHLPSGWVPQQAPTGVLSHTPSPHPMAVVAPPQWQQPAAADEQAAVRRAGASVGTRRPAARRGRQEEAGNRDEGTSGGDPSSETLARSGSEDGGPPAARRQRRRSSITSDSEGAAAVQPAAVAAPKAAARAAPRGRLAAAAAAAAGVERDEDMREAEGPVAAKRRAASKRAAVEADDGGGQQTSAAEADVGSGGRGSGRSKRPKRVQR